jgi:hypothetical protein
MRFAKRHLFHLIGPLVAVVVVAMITPRTIHAVAAGLGSGNKLFG